jgi:hypothetical protein
MEVNPHKHNNVEFKTVLGVEVSWCYLCGQLSLLGGKKSRATFVVGSKTPLFSDDGKDL